MHFIIMVSLTFHNAHPHDHFAPIARIDSRTMESIGVVEGDILEVIGKRRTVAKCKLLEENEATRNPSTVWLTKTVGNNAEVPLGAVVEIKKSGGAVEARRIVIAPSHADEITKNLDRLQITQHLSSMLAGSPVLLGDYVVTYQPMGPWIVFEVLDVERSATASDVSGGENPVLISKKTTIEVKRPDEMPQKGEELPRRGYPVFWVNVRDGVRKTDNENVFLMMSFWGLHYDGRYAGEFQRKINNVTDIQNLVSRYTEVAQREIDSVNEEARTGNLSAESVKNRILQRWMDI